MAALRSTRRIGILETENSHSIINTFDIAVVVGGL